VLGSIIVLVVVVGCLDTTPPPMPVLVPHHRVTVGEITAEFEANEYAATQKYTDKATAVSGYVHDIGMTLDKIPLVKLVQQPRDTTFGPAVICYFAKSYAHPGLAELRKGDYATIVGIFLTYADIFETVYLGMSRIE